MNKVKSLLLAQENKVSDLERELASERSRLEGMRLVAQEFDDVSEIATDNSEAAPKRRMRLGSKKRVVYSLVDGGNETVESLCERLSSSDIDPRYVRDVVRVAINEGDMLGNLDDRFIMSDFGKELLESAPLPRDWQNYSHLVDGQHQMSKNKASSTEVEEALRVTEDAPTSSEENSAVRPPWWVDSSS
ncbi:MAG: hypothetical protein AAFR71_01740 [Pseudomonadota bacterium]